MGDPVLEFFILLSATYMFVHFRPTGVWIVTVAMGLILIIPTTYYIYMVHGIFINSAFSYVNSVIPLFGMGGMICRGL